MEFLKDDELPQNVGEEYLLNFIREITPYTEDAASPALEHSLADGVPVLSEETKNLLGTLLEIHKPSQILEIGTAYGFSAVYMSQFLSQGGHIDTIERNPVMIREARTHLAPFADTICLHEGAAQDIIPGLSGPYDFVLIDAGMGQYALFWEEIQDKLSPGAVVFCDNVLHGGLVAMDRYEIPRRQRTIHQRMRDFLTEVLADKDYQSALLPVGDGVLIAVRKTNIGKDAA